MPVASQKGWRREVGVGEVERGRRERQRSSEFNFPFISLNFQDTIKNQCWAKVIYGLVVGHLPVMFKEL